MKLLKRLLTKNKKAIPLMWIDFNHNKYKINPKGSCDLRVHPNLSGDKYIRNELNKIVEYVKANYDMEEI